VLATTTTELRHGVEVVCTMLGKVIEGAGRQHEQERDASPLLLLSTFSFLHAPRLEAGLAGEHGRWGLLR
jgi:hypothetical protein